MKKSIRFLLMLGLSVVCSVLTFVITSFTDTLSEEIVFSRIRNIMSADKGQITVLPDGEVIQYRADQGDIVDVTLFYDGRTRYEYYCCDTEKIYSFYDDRINIDIDSMNTNVQSIEMEVFDAAAYRKRHKKTERNDFI